MLSSGQIWILSQTPYILFDGPNLTTLDFDANALPGMYHSILPACRLTLGWSTSDRCTAVLQTLNDSPGCHPVMSTYGYCTCCLKFSVGVCTLKFTVVQGKKKQQQDLPSCGGGRRRPWLSVVRYSLELRARPRDQVRPKKKRHR